MDDLLSLLPFPFPSFLLSAFGLCALLDRAGSDTMKNRTLKVIFAFRAT